MIDLSDSDQLFRIVTVFLLVMVVAAVGLLVTAGLMAAQEDDETPSVEWKLTQLNETHAELRHTGGPPVRPENLTVVVDGTPTNVTWSKSLLVEGDSGVFRIGIVKRVTLLWTQSRRDREELDRWHISRTDGNISIQRR